MSQLTIRRPHALSRPEAQRRVARAADKLVERFGAVCRWDGELLRIEHSSVNGTVRIAADEIVVDARLGAALSLFRGRAEREIARIL